ncbi:hypothetical protein ACFQE8_11170 [Salinirubellus sp. GCM10025818]|jgi:hypothetical protein|uniref:hypothetical protein n=1 Tax=Salinirubellus TaxID=2162630 RepID=UPI0030D1AAA8
MGTSALRELVREYQSEYHGGEMGLYSQRMVRIDRYKYVFNAPDVDESEDPIHRSSVKHLSGE